MSFKLNVWHYLTTHLWKNSVNLRTNGICMNATPCLRKGNRIFFRGWGLSVLLFRCDFWNFFIYWIYVFSADSYFYFIISLSLLFVLVRICGRKTYFYFFTVMLCALNNILWTNVYKMLSMIILFFSLINKFYFIFSLSHFLMCGIV